MSRNFLQDSTDLFDRVCDAVSAVHARCRRRAADPVFVAPNRYLDLFTGAYVSLYNTLMKLFFIGSSAYIVFLMKVKFRCASRGYLSGVQGLTPRSADQHKIPLLTRSDSSTSWVLVPSSLSSSTTSCAASSSR